MSHENDETLPIINKTKAPKKGGNTRNKMEVPKSKKTKEPPKRANHKGEHQVPDQVPKPPPITRSISNKSRGGALGEI